MAPLAAPDPFRLDLRTFSPLGDSGAWQVAADGATASAAPGGPYFLVGAESQINLTLRGRVRAAQAGLLGFVFGYRPEESRSADDLSLVLLDWASKGSGSAEGLTLSRVHGTPSSLRQALRRHQGEGVEVVSRRTAPGSGFVPGREHVVELAYRKTRVRATIDGQLVLDAVGSFPEGRLGFFAQGQGDLRFSDFSVRIENGAPTADAGEALTVEAQADCAAQITLDASRSTDPDGDVLSYAWTGPFGAAEGPKPAVTLPVGVHSLTLAVDDGNGEKSEDTVDVIVTDRTAPVLACPADVMIVADPKTRTAREVSLGAPTAIDNCAVRAVTHDAPVEFPVGTSRVTWTAVDESGHLATCEQAVTVLDGAKAAATATAGPAVSATVATSSLWPPNHGLRDVGLTVAVSHPSGVKPAVTVKVWADEPDDSQTGDGNRWPDAQLATNKLQLRSERKGDADGRVYLIAATATDNAGLTARSCTTVTVPHSQSPADKDAVAAQAAQARALCEATGDAPVGYFLLAQGPYNGSDPCGAVKPILECVVANADGTFAAVFGYQNENAVPVTIPIGANNTFTPAPADQGQPVTFVPGRSPATGAFVVPFEGTPPEDGECEDDEEEGEDHACGEDDDDEGASPLSWTLKGLDGKRRTVRASACCPHCTTPPATPNARDDAATTPQDTPVTIAVLANDGDPQGDPLTVVRVSQPAHGTVVINGGTTVTYTPAAGFLGVDSFNYVVSDGGFGTDLASVQVTVEDVQVNQPPQVDAGPDRTITLPISSVTLAGTVSDDGLPAGGQLTVAWSQVSGSAPVVFGSPASATTMVTFSATGSYVLRLTGNDGALSSSNEMVVTVDPPIPVISITGLSLSEGHHGTALATLTVGLSVSTERTVSVAYGTLDGTAGACDYFPRAGTLTFQPGEVSKTIVVPIAGDLVVEGDEGFFVQLLEPTGGTLGVNRATVTIVDDDQANQPPTAPGQRLPADRAEGVVLTPTLSWMASDPDPGDTPKFDVFLGTAFDLGSQSWSRTCPTGSTTPSPRSATASAYDPQGDRLIVFGGSPGSGPSLGDLWVLDNASGAGATPSWRAVSTGAGPSPRRSASFVLDPAGDRGVLFGGCADDCETAQSDAWVLIDPAGLAGAPSWQPLPAAPVARLGHAAAFAPSSGRLIVFGGAEGAGRADSNELWVLKDATVPATAEWLPLAVAGDVPPARHAAASAYDTAGDRLFVVGGRNSAGEVFADAWVLRHASGVGGVPEWTALQPAGPAPAPRWGGVLAYDAPSGRLLLTAGASADPASGPVYPFNDAWILDGVDGASPSWSPVMAEGDRPGGRFLSAGGYTPANARFVLALGASPAHPNGLDDLWQLSNPFGRLPLVAEGQAAPSFAAGPLPADVLHYWRVVARDARGAFQGSSVFRFTPGSPIIDVAGASSPEGDQGASPLGFALTLSSARDHEVTVDWTTADGSAAAGEDYTPAGGTVTFLAGSTAATATVDVLGDLRPETDETFGITLSNAQRAVVRTSSATGVIVDDDSANDPPVVDAGPDRTVEPGLVPVAGSASDDGLPPPGTLSTLWSQVSGPAALAFADPAALETTVTLSESGVYVLRLTASDGQLSASDDVTLEVPAGNEPPVVSAGPDQNLLAPAASTSLSGFVTDDGLPQGSSLTSLWSQISGPEPVMFGDPTLPATSVTLGAPGVYVLRLTASDGTLSASDEMTVTLLRPNAPPVVSAGPDQTLSLPQTQTQLLGTASDDGVPGIGLVTSWSVTSGPTGVVFADPSATATAVSFPGVGGYVLRLTAGDGELSASDEATVTVGDVADLVVDAVDASGAAVNGQTLAVSGPVVVRVRNAGVGSAGPFQVAFFEDRDRSGAYEPGTDELLGSVQHPSLAAGENATLSSELNGTLLFVGNLVWAFADSTRVVPETDEANNYGNSAPPCAPPPPQPFAPVLEWAWTSSSVNPTYTNVMSTPAVADLNLDGVPDVVFASYPGSSYGGYGTLRALDGADGSERFSASASGSEVNAVGNVAIGDIDGDSFPEVVTFQSNRPIAFEHDGTRKWLGSTGESVGWGGPSLADLDGDGLPEIIAGRQVFNSDGSIRWTGAGTSGNIGGTGPLSLVADLDMDGTPEVVAGPTAYRADGTLFWRAAGLPDGGTAVGNFDGDPYPEIVLTASGRVWLLEHDGTIKWGPITHPGGGVPGPPTVADFDGDGQPEIGVAGASRYTVFETNGAVRWSAAISDTSSGRTGSSVFDFEGDGQAEAVYRDQQNLFVFRGTDGAILSSKPLSSCTTYEYPLVVDVDGDGNSEIVSPANDTCGYGTSTGIHVYGDANDQWVATRRIWNQHTYHITNVNDDGTIPRHESPGWLSYNSYRQNVLTGGCAFAQPDVTASYVRVARDGGLVSLTARIGNAGVGVGRVDAAFYDGDPRGGGRLLGVTRTSASVPAGGYEDVTLQVPPYESAYPLWVVADDDGDGTGALAESNEQNNFYEAPFDLVPTPNQPPLADAGPDQTGPAGAVGLAGSVSDDGLPHSTLLSVWTAVSGPGAVSFADTTQPATTATFALPGTYVLRLTASDGDLTAQDDVTITATPANQPPTVDAGPDQAATLPTNTVTLQGQVSDDGLPSPAVTLAWSQQSGPATVTFANPSSAVTLATAPVVGTYVLRLTASDGELSANDDVTVRIGDATSLPDLTVGAVDTTALQVDDGTFELSGVVTAVVANPGLAPAGTPFTLTFFEDRNGNELFDPATDGLLGATDLASLGIGAVQPVTIALSGSLLFRGNRVHAFVDSGAVVVESDETNNYDSETCLGEAPVPPEGFTLVAQHTLDITTLQGAYHDPDRNEVAVFSYYGGVGRVLRPDGTRVRNLTVPPSATNALDGAAYDRRQRRALLVTQACVVTEVDPGTMASLAVHSLSGFGLSICAGIEVGPDNNVYVVSYGTNELVALDRAFTGVVRRISAVTIGVPGIDGVVAVPGASDRLAALSSTVNRAVIISLTGSVLAGPAVIGQPPFAGTMPSNIFDAIAGLCVNGHIWICEAYGSRCLDFAPTGGDVSTCCARPDLVAGHLRATADPSERLLTARIGNAGGAPAPQHLVTFYDGEPFPDGVALGTVSTSASLPPGSFEDVTLRLPLATTTDRTVWVVADDNGHGGGLVDESNELNNAHDSGRTLTSSAGLPDLAPAGFELADVTTDPLTLALAGDARVVVHNQGDVAAGAFEVTVFADRNGNGAFDPGFDLVLGASPVVASLPGEPVEVAVVLAGTLLFLDEPLFVRVDSGDSVVESNEGNNIARAGGLCAQHPSAGVFSPRVERSWQGSTVNPTSVGVMTTPLVVDLDGDTRPEIVFSTHAGTSMTPATLRAIRGRDRSEVFTTTTNVRVSAQLAAGDIDGDGRPEIVAVSPAGNTLLAFEHDGTLKWTSATIENVGDGGPAIANIDGVGLPEIVVGRQVLNPDGTVRWTGTAGVGGIGGPRLSIVVDLDGDGLSEIVAGNSAYRADGSLAWTAAGTADGWTAVADVDDDGRPEVLLSSGNRTWCLEHDGAVKWGPVSVGPAYMGAPPVVADVDGDGRPEAIVSVDTNLVALDGLATAAYVRWSLPVNQYYYEAMPAAFDFDRDGAAEIVFTDGDALRILRGADGKLLGQLPLGSFALRQGVVVADADGDGAAEILTGASPYAAGTTAPGLYVVGDANGAWQAARRIWNQASYHVTNVNDDGTIPPVESPSWLGPNSYRANVPVGTLRYGAVDLTASYPRVVATQAATQLTVRVGNGGSVFAAAGVAVSFYDGHPGESGVLLGTAVTTQDLGPGQFEDVTLSLDPGAYVGRVVWAAADDEGGLVGRHLECNEANNFLDTGFTLNQAPVADAGGDQTIVFPSNSAALVGSVTDDGIPVGVNIAVRWTKLSGPGLALFANPSSAATTVSFTRGGVYVLRLTASDSVLVSADEVTITVTGPNEAPVVNAGPDAMVGHPNDTHALSGAASDDGLPLGSTLSVSWSQVSGPAPAVLADPGSVLTTVRLPAVGTYVLRLTASDSQLTTADEVQVVRLPPNQAPVVDAGPDRRTSLPATSTTLIGSATDDSQPLGAQLSYAWSVVSGPGAVSFSSSATAVTQATFGAVGAYLLRLTVSDSELSASDDVTVELLPPNTAPTVDARPDREIEAAEVLLIEAAVSDDGLPSPPQLTVAWSQLSGPGAALFSDPTSATTSLQFSRAGSYLLRLSASDGELSASDDVAVTVRPGNLAPVVSAGPDRTLQQPASVLTLAGSASDDGQPEGSTLSMLWSRVSGPGPVVFATPPAAVSQATLATAGTYVLRLTASDTAATRSDDVTVVVVPRNTAPVVNAGPDQSLVSPPATQIVLSGNVNDDGLPQGGNLVSLWQQVGGPAAVVIADPSSPTTTTTFTRLGVYAFRLYANDSLLTAYDDVVVNVADGNQPPVVDAGPDQTIAFPTLTATLAGSALDDGLPVGAGLRYQWSLASGPAFPAFADATAPATTVTLSSPGTYVLRLMATDTLFTRVDTMSLTLQAAPPTGPPPSVEIMSPAHGAAVTETTAVVGTVASEALQRWTLEYRAVGDGSWTPLGTGTGPVTAGTLGTLDPTLLLNGQYELRLSATDLSARSVATTRLVVAKENQKIGHFTVSFVDAEVPVAGLPVRITRTYDSRDKRFGDFGYGWRLDLSSVRVSQSRGLAAPWTSTKSAGAFPSYCVQTAQPPQVTLTFPDGRVADFRMELSIGGRTLPCQSLWPPEAASVRFVPVGNTLGQLDLPAGSEVLIVGDWPSHFSQTGSVSLFDWSFGDFAPTLFRYTSPDGQVMLIDKVKGLQSLTDLSGNTLRVGPNGIASCPAGVAPGGEGCRGLVFQRGTGGRIVTITDPSGFPMSYGYDGNGDLVSFTDREHNTTTFTYEPTIPHHLATIVDALGRTPIRNEYFPDGRIRSHTDAFGKTIEYSHDVTGRQEVVTDRNGKTRVLHYDGRGNVLKEIDPNGKQVLRSFDARNNRLSETEPHDAVTTNPPTTAYVYDAADNLLSVTDPNNNTTEYTYNSRKQVLTSKDPKGTYTINAYDTKGNLTSTKVATSHGPPLTETSYTYNASGNLLTQTVTVDGLAQVTQYAYDAQGNLTKETDALGHETTYTYDSNGSRLTQTTTRTTYACTGTGCTPSGTETLSTAYEYDKLGRLKKTTDPDATFTQTVYDALGKQVESYDKLGRKTAYQYDLMGRLEKTTYPDLTTEESTYDGEGRRLTSKDRGGRVTTYEYDGLGRLLKTIFPDLAFTENTYDDAGRLVATKDARGKTTFYEYDRAGRRTKVRAPLSATVFAETVFTYDANGNQKTVKDPNGAITTFDYDEQNRRTKTTFPPALAGDPTTYTETTYDTLGRRTAERDQAGKVTQFRYDKLGRLEKVIDALTHETTYGYDELGNRTSQRDASGRVTSFEYDKLGREKARVLPDGSRETKTYDVAGNLKTRTDFMGRTTTYDYDTNSRVTSRTYPDPAENVSFTYTATGRRLTATDARGTTEYGYDLRDRLTSLTQPSAGALGYVYDNNGNRTGLTATIGTQVLTTTFTHDDANRLDIVTDPAARAYDHGYDANGNRSSLSHPNGTQTAYTYNTLNRLTNLATNHPASGVTIQSYAFTLGPAGNRTRIVEHDGTARDYGYDDLYRLTSETVTISGLTEYGKTFLYDNVGNRQTQTTIGTGSPGTPTAPGTIGYAYDTRDRITTEGSQPYAWDLNGNLTSKDAEATYVWDFENRLTRVTKLDGTLVEHLYDTDGNRVQTKTTPPSGPTTTTNFLVDTSGGLSHAVAETDEAGALKAYYVRGDDLLAVMRPLVPVPTTPADWQTRFVHADGLGSIRRLTDENGLITDGYSYTAFGELLAHTGTDPQPYAFAGEPYDPNSGFQYHRARWMDPRVGRFVGMDLWDGNPFEPITLHKYLYGDAAPSWKVDPTGRFSLAGAIAVVAVIAIIAAIAVFHFAPKRPRTVAVKWSTDFVFDGARLSGTEKLQVKAKAHATAKSAFSGLPLTVVEGAAGLHRLDVVNVPSSFKEWGGFTRSSSESEVFYSPHEEKARFYAAGLGFDRPIVLDGLGHALGATIAHETAHQVLGGSQGQQFMDHRGDPATYDHWRDSFDTFYGSLTWSPPTWAALQQRLN